MGKKRRKPDKPTEITFKEVKEIVYQHNKLTQSKILADNYIKVETHLK